VNDFIKALIAQDMNALARLTKDMAYLAQIVKNLPGDFEYSAEDLATLDAAGQEAALLADRCAACLKGFFRKNDRKG